MMPKPIGGFFELELPPGPHRLHGQAREALSSGRACLMRLCQELRPTRVYLPFYVCDSVLMALDAAATPYRFYGLTETLELPELPRMAEGEYLLYINYFGLKDDYVATLQAHYAGRLWLDLTQAFYYVPRPEQWAFNSARKFFGVPDGAYLYGAGPTTPVGSPLVNKSIEINHLLWRQLGRQQQAYAAFSAYEAGFSCEVSAMSDVSRTWLSWIDYPVVKARRLANFARYHELLGAYNEWQLPQQPTGVPFCYPLRLPALFNRPLLFAQNIFVPALWREVQTRAGHENYSWEVRLVDELLPLPVDHRYTPEDIDFVAAQVLSGLSPSAGLSASQRLC